MDAGRVWCEELDAQIMRDLAAAESEEPQPQMRIDRLGISDGAIDALRRTAAAAVATADEGAGADDTTAPASLSLLTDALRAGEHGRARFTSELAALEQLAGTLSLPSFTTAEPQPSLRAADDGGGGGGDFDEPWWATERRKMYADERDREAARQRAADELQRRLAEAAAETARAAAAAEAELLAVAKAEAEELARATAAHEAEREVAAAARASQAAVEAERQRLAEAALAELERRSAEREAQRAERDRVRARKQEETARRQAVVEAEERRRAEQAEREREAARRMEERKEKMRVRAERTTGCQLLSSLRISRAAPSLQVLAEEEARNRMIDARARAETAAATTAQAAARGRTARIERVVLAAAREAEWAAAEKAEAARAAAAVAAAAELARRTAEAKRLERTARAEELRRCAEEEARRQHMAEEAARRAVEQAERLRLAKDRRRAKEAAWQRGARTVQAASRGRAVRRWRSPRAIAVLTVQSSWRGARLRRRLTAALKAACFCHSDDEEEFAAVDDSWLKATEAWIEDAPALQAEGGGGSWTAVTVTPPPLAAPRDDAVRGGAATPPLSLPSPPVAMLAWGSRPASSAALTESSLSRHPTVPLVAAVTHAAGAAQPRLLCDGGGDDAAADDDDELFVPHRISFARAPPQRRPSAPADEYRLGRAAAARLETQAAGCGRVLHDAAASAAGVGSDSPASSMAPGELRGRSSEQAAAARIAAEWGANAAGFLRRQRRLTQMAREGERRRAMQDPMRRLAALQRKHAAAQPPRAAREAAWRVKPPSEVSTTALQWIEGSTAQRGSAPLAFDCGGEVAEDLELTSASSLVDEPLEHHEAPRLRSFTSNSSNAPLPAGSALQVARW